jgi:diaminopimelate epimerase
MGASVVAGIATGRLDRTVRVNVPGGRTIVTVEESGTTWLTGPAAISFYGEFPL